MSNNDGGTSCHTTGHKVVKERDLLLFAFFLLSRRCRWRRGQIVAAAATALRCRLLVSRPALFGFRVLGIVGQELMRRRCRKGMVEIIAAKPLWFLAMRSIITVVVTLVLALCGRRCRTNSTFLQSSTSLIATVSSCHDAIKLSEKGTTVNCDCIGTKKRCKKPVLSSRVARVRQVCAAVFWHGFATA